MLLPKQQKRLLGPRRPKQRRHAPAKRKRLPSGLLRKRPLG